MPSHAAAANHSTDHCPSAHAGRPPTATSKGTPFDFCNDVLGNISGGRVLDIATSRGGFIHMLTSGLKDYTEITGIDISAEMLQAAQNAFSGSDDSTHQQQKGIRFIQMDAERLGFKDGCFDTVSIGVSLHHMANLSQVLSEIKRVLQSPAREKPGGTCIVSEMYRDGQSDPQLTVVHMHDWAAEVDTALGVVHNPTFTRQEIIDILEEMGLRDLSFYDIADVDQDPKNEAAIEQGEATIQAVTQRAQGLPDFEGFKRRGEEIAVRLHDVGAQIQSVLIAVGTK